MERGAGRRSAREAAALLRGIVSTSAPALAGDCRAARGSVTLAGRLEPLQAASMSIIPPRIQRQAKRVISNVTARVKHS